MMILALSRANLGRVNVDRAEYLRESSYLRILVAFEAMRCPLEGAIVVVMDELWNNDRE